MIRLALPLFAALLVFSFSFPYSAPPAFAKKGSELRDETPDHGGRRNDPDDRRTHRDSDDHSGRDGRHGGRGDEGRIERILSQADDGASDSGSSTRDEQKVRIREGDRF